VRIADLIEWGETNRCLNEVKARLKELGLNGEQQAKRISYMGVPLREPAPKRFLGMLGGVIEVYRCVSKNTDQVFTPIGEHVVVQLAEAATPFVMRAFNSERRFSQMSIAFPSRSIGSVNSAERLNAELKTANESFRHDLQRLLAGWEIARGSKRSYFAFRTLPSKWATFWTTKPAQDFDNTEKEARLQLRQSILSHEDLFGLDESAHEVDSSLLKRFEVAKQHRDRLLELGIVLVPLVDREQLAGVLGLEFGGAPEAHKAA